MATAQALDLGGDLWDVAEAAGVPYAELACLARSLGRGATLRVEPGACVVEYPAGPVRFAAGWLEGAEILRRAGLLGGHGLGEGGGEA